MSSGRTSPVTRIFCFSLLTTMSCSPDTMKLPLASIESICIDSRASNVPLRSICPPPANWLSKPTLASWISPSRCSRFALADSPLRSCVCAWVLMEATSLMSTVSTSPGICARRSENSERGADTASAAAAATGASASNAVRIPVRGLSIIFLLLRTARAAPGPVTMPMRLSPLDLSRSRTRSPACASAVAISTRLTWMPPLCAVSVTARLRSTSGAGSMAGIAQHFAGREPPARAPA